MAATPFSEKCTHREREPRSLHQESPDHKLTMLYDTLGVFRKSLEPAELDLSRHHVAFAVPRWYGSMNDAVTASLRQAPDLMIIELTDALDPFAEEISLLRTSCPPAPLILADPFASRSRLRHVVNNNWGSYFPTPLQPAEIIASFLRRRTPRHLRERPASSELPPGSAPTANGRWSKQHSGPVPEPTTPLTRTETLVLKLAAEGNNCMKIAGIMGISVRTVYVHTRSIYRKLQVHSLVEALARFSQLQHDNEPAIYR